MNTFVEDYDLRLDGRQVSRRAVEDGLEVLADLLRAMRWDDQGGYHSYAGNGKWGFVATCLPNVTPYRLNKLFAAVGIKPDEIIPKGSCSQCVYSKDGRDGGWYAPCSSCKHPVMHLFKKGKPGSATQAQRYAAMRRERKRREKEKARR